MTKKYGKKFTTRYIENTSNGFMTLIPKHINYR